MVGKTGVPGRNRRLQLDTTEAVWDLGKGVWKRQMKKPMVWEDGVIAMEDEDGKLQGVSAVSPVEDGEDGEERRADECPVPEVICLRSPPNFRVPNL